MLKYLIYRILICALISIGILDCDSPPQVTADDQKNKEYYFYYYENADVPLSMSAYPLKQGDNLKVEEVLDLITSVLTEHFQRNEYIPNIDSLIIEFEQINKFKVGIETFEIAIINIIDPTRICMSYFFQGSTGGETTFNELGANLLQPELENHSLVDGVIILYNGLPLPALDHINLSGILVPRFFEDAAFHAKIRSKKFQ